MLQRLAVARALVHEPAVLILDEPYTGLDPAGADLLDAVIREQAQSGRGVLLTSHDLERALRVAGRVAILARGRIAVDEPTPGMTADQLRTRYRETLK
jgi:ABC-type multidrug transport system ATPase subunit